MTLSPTKDHLQSNAKIQPQQPQPPKLFIKRSSPSNQFHSLPQSSIGNPTGTSNHSHVQSWEAYNNLEEITQESHVHHKSIQSIPDYTMEMDSLSARYHQELAEDFREDLEGNDDDSLNFNLQEVDEQDSLGQEAFYEHDSLQIEDKPAIKNRDREKKKLIIPYNESFSSTNSIFTTSQDGSLDSCTKHQNEEEEDSLTQSNPNLTLNMAPIKPWLDEIHQHSVSNPNLTKINPVPTRVYNHQQQSSPVINSDFIASIKPLAMNNPSSEQLLLQDGTSRPEQPVVNQLAPNSATNTTTSPSLMKLATERMKRKFLGWN